MRASPLFLDTEDADRAAVLERFPDARFADADLQGDALVSACRDAEIVSCFITTSFPRSVLEKLPALKLLCTRSVGYDHIDLAACREKGVTVCNVPDYGSHVIAEHVFALLLSAVRHVREGMDRVRGGSFDYRGLRGMALQGKTMGLLGTGKIGRAVARIARGFGMDILGSDPYPSPVFEAELGGRYVPVDELLERSDVLSLHMPASDATRHFLDRRAFARMKRGAVLVNTARGALVDSQALLEALDAGVIAYALLDVLEHEHDLTKDEALIRHPRVIVTPHIAFYADDSMRSMYADSLRSIAQWMAGEEPEHSVRAA